MAEVVPMEAGFARRFTESQRSPCGWSYAWFCVLDGSFASCPPWWSESRAHGGPGPPLEVAVRWGIRIQPERPSRDCVLWTVERLAE